MGKFERSEAEKIEQLVAGKIGGEAHGNKSFEAGDITLPGGEIIEVKSSQNGSAYNTLANIGQDSLTIYGLFETISWREFRKEGGFEKFKEDIYNRYPEFKKLSKTEFTKNIRSFLTEDEFEEIAEENKENIIQYIEVLKEVNQNVENVKTFYLNMINGRHSYKTYDGNLREMDDTFSTICVDKSGEIIKKIKYFFDDKYEYKIKFKDGTKDIFLCAEKDGFEKFLLRIVFHWKNKGQGIQTPCLNIFYCT